MSKQISLSALEQQSTKLTTCCILIPSPKSEQKSIVLDLTPQNPVTTGFDHIQSIRKQWDKSVNRWPPHMNLLHPFIHKKQFFKAKQLIEEALVDFPPIKITLPAHHIHCNAGSKFVLTGPTYPQQIEQLQKLYTILKGLFPQCSATGSLFEGGDESKKEGKGLASGKSSNQRSPQSSVPVERFEPHLTLGQLSNSTIATQRKKGTELTEYEIIERDWCGIEFVACELALMWRETTEDPFKIGEIIP